jgi:hypothetical protein
MSSVLRPTKVWAARDERRLENLFSIKQLRFFLIDAAAMVNLLRWQWLASASSKNRETCSGKRMV